MILLNIINKAEKEWYEEFILWAETADSNSYKLVVGAIAIIIITLCVSFLITNALIYIRLRRYFLARLKTQIENTFVPYIIDLVMKANEDEKHRKYLIKKLRFSYFIFSFCKRIFLKQLLKFQDNIVGIYEVEIDKLYLELGLYKLTMQDLKSPKWDRKIDGIRVCRQLKFQESIKVIKKLTRHEHPIVRQEAHIAMVAISDNNPFEFLTDLRSPISEWEQINLEEISHTLEPSIIPNFSNWFDSDIPSVVEFCVKMTLSKNQIDSSDKIIDLLNSVEKKVVLVAIKACGKFKLIESTNKLISMYQNTSAEIQEEIVKNLGLIGDKTAINFLIKLLSESNHPSAFAAGNSIRLMGSEGLVILKNAMNDDNPITASIAKHMLDERIHL